MEEKRLQRLERHSRLYHWAGSVGKWLQEQNHGDVVYLSNGNGAVTFPPVLLVKKTPGKAEGLRQRKTQKERDKGAGRSLVFFRGLCSHGENVGWIVGF